MVTSQREAICGVCFLTLTRDSISQKSSESSFERVGGQLKGIYEEV
jgi:hypothetical protein